MRRARFFDGQLALPLAASAAVADAAAIESADPPLGPPLPLPPRPLPTPLPPSAPAPDAIAIVRRRGTRRYVLRVLDDGTVRVTVPWWGSRRGALAFAASQRAWIDRQRARRRGALTMPWRAGRPVLLDGAAHPIAVADDGSAWVDGQRVASTGDDPDALRRGVHSWLRARAREELPRALEGLAGRHGLTVTRITIRDQASRWGSCSRQGAISLNWRLVQMPPWVREYVLVHELMHRRQLNHSPRFWRLVAAACPRYLEARRWLRTEGQALFG